MKYSNEEIMNVLHNYVVAYHNTLAIEERRVGHKCYDRFGEWKTANPNHPLAKKAYPANEYLQVISMYRDYFNSKYPSTTGYELEL